MSLGRREPPPDAVDLPPPHSVVDEAHDRAEKVHPAVAAGVGGGGGAVRGGDLEKGVRWNLESIFCITFLYRSYCRNLERRRQKY